MSKKAPGLRQILDGPCFKAAQKRTTARYRQFGVEIRQAHDAMVEREDYPGTWWHLERAHVLSQTSAWRHFCVHFVMFIYALTRREFREAVGQVPRMVLAVPSSLLGVAPNGNSGRSNVGLFSSEVPPKDLKELLRQ